mgnify:CR=1 FL=1
MNKKVEDIKVEQITEDQLKDLQGHIGKINQAQLNLGQLESQKHNLLHGISAMQKELNTMQLELEKEYGNVSINIKDGTITDVPDEANTKD